MTEGWIESEIEPPHRDDAAEELFVRECSNCQHRMDDINAEPISGRTFVRCFVCRCPLKIVVHRYGNCPEARVPNV